MPQARHLVTTLAMLPHTDERNGVRKTQKRELEVQTVDEDKWKRRERI